MSINRQEKVEIENLKNLTAFVDYLQKNNYVYEYLEYYNPAKKRKVLIVFDDIIVDMEANKKLSAIVTVLFIRVRKVNISLALISKSYFKVPNHMILNETHYEHS